MRCDSCKVRVPKERISWGYECINCIGGIMKEEINTTLKQQEG